MCFVDVEKAFDCGRVTLRKEDSPEALVRAVIEYVLRNKDKSHSCIKTLKKHLCWKGYITVWRYHHCCLQL